jgi:T5SS/PEP-CTERM-associated repeat protein
LIRHVADATDVCAQSARRNPRLFYCIASRKKNTTVSRPIQQPNGRRTGDARTRKLAFELLEDRRLLAIAGLDPTFGGSGIINVLPITTGDVALQPDGILAYRQLRSSFTFAALIAIGLVVATDAVAQAITKNWTGDSGDWSPGHWAPPGPPNASDPVRIVFNDATNRTVTLNITTPALGLVSLDNDGGRNSTLSIPTNVNLTAAAIAVGGYNGSTFTTGRGNVNQADGAVTTTAGGDLILAWGSGSTGTYSLTGGAVVANQAEFVGYGGAGTFNHSAGTNTINASALGSLTIGATAGSTGTYNLSGSGMLMTNASQYVGNSGTGNFNQSGGTNSVSSTLYLGHNAGSTGTYTLSGSGSLVTGNAVVGDAGVGTLTIQDQASMHVSNNLSINSLSTVNLNGGTLGLNTVTGTSLNQLNYSAGTIQLAGSRTIGSDPIVQTLFGASPTIPTGKGLTVQGTATLAAALTLNGGSFSASQMINPHLVQVNHGTLDIPNQARTIGSGEVLNLASDATINYGLGITNQGVLKGDGQLGGALFHNTSAGEVIAEIDKSLAISALSNANDGKMTLAGGSLVFLHQLANNPGGAVSGNGTIVANGGLVNHGTMSFSGVANVTTNGDFLNDGDIDVTSLLNIIAANIQIDGEMRIAGEMAHIAMQAATVTVINGAVTVDHGTISANNGIIIGTPQRRAEIDSLLAGIPVQLREEYNETQQDLAEFTQQLLLQGHLVQPSQAEASLLDAKLAEFIAALQAIEQRSETLAAILARINAASTIIADTEVQGTFVAGGTAGISTVDVVGNLSFDTASSLEMELAGTDQGQFDTIQVDGNASFELGAHLALTMLDPSNFENGTNLFLPEPGDFFDVLTADAIDAEFLLIEAPEFDNRAFVAGVVDLGVDAGQALRITVVPVGLAGDYNENGVVDGADFLVWQRNLGSDTSLPNDDTPGVGPEDYAVWRARFGQTAPASGAALSTVPEPTSLVPLLIAAAFAAAWRSRRFGAPLLRSS